MRKTTNLSRRRNSPASQNLAKTQPVQRKNFSPKKKAKELSELTPVQFFQKRFGELEVHFYELKKYSPPGGCDHFFQSFVNFKSLIPSFALHSNKILKQRVLSTPLNLKSFEACSHFREELPLFFQSVQHFSGKIKRLYQKSIFNYFKIMVDNYNKFTVICYQDPHTRNLMGQYDLPCREALKKIEIVLRGFFDQQKFQLITIDETLDITENIKTLGRFYMFDLQRILGPYLGHSPELDEYNSNFKDAFLHIVPMLSAIPCFRDEFRVILTKIEPVQEAFDKLVKYIGDTPDAIRLKKKPALTGVQPELEIIPIDPLKEPLDNLSNFLQITAEEGQSNEQRVNAISKNIQEKIKSLNQEIERVQKRLNTLEPMNTREAIIDRFEQIRLFKAEFTKQEEKVRNDFMRNTIYQVKALTNNTNVCVNDNYQKQLRQIITEVSDDLTKKEIEINGLKAHIKDTKVLFSQILNKDNKESVETNKEEDMKIHDLAREMISDYRQLQKENNENKLKIHKFLTNNISTDIKSMLSDNDLTIDESLSYISKEIDSQKKEISDLKSQISKQNNTKLAFKKETVNVLEKVHFSINKIYNSYFSNPFDNGKAPEKLTELRDQIKEMLAKLEEKQTEDRNKLMNFLIKIIVHLNLPNVDFSKGGTDAYDQAMAAIIDCLTIPTKSDLFINTSPEFQRIKSEEYKSFLCDICVRITQKPKEDFEKYDIDNLKRTIFLNLEIFLTRTDLSRFNDLLPKHEDFEIIEVLTKQLKMSQKINNFALKIKDKKDIKEINANLAVLINDDDLNNDIKEGLIKINNYIEQNQSQLSITEMKEQIDSLNQFISSKDRKIKEISEKMEECQKRFFEYVDAIKTQSENHQEILQDIQSQEIQAIVDFFSKVERNNE